MQKAIPVIGVPPEERTPMQKENKTKKVEKPPEKPKPPGVQDTIAHATLTACETMLTEEERKAYNLFCHEINKVPEIVGLPKNFKKKAKRRWKYQWLRNRAKIMTGGAKFAPKLEYDQKAVAEVLKTMKGMTIKAAKNAQNSIGPPKLSNKQKKQQAETHKKPPPLMANLIAEPPVTDRSMIPDYRGNEPRHYQGGYGGYQYLNNDWITPNQPNNWNTPEPQPDPYQTPFQTSSFSSSSYPSRNTYSSFPGSSAPSSYATAFPSAAFPSLNCSPAPPTSSFASVLPEIISEVVRAEQMSQEPLSTHFSSYSLSDPMTSMPNQSAWRPTTSTGGSDQSAMQRRLAEIEQELQEIEQKKIEMAMQEEVRRREAELRERERWIEMREREIRELEKYGRGRERSRSRSRERDRDRRSSRPSSDHHHHQYHHRPTSYTTRGYIDTRPASYANEISIEQRDRLREERNAAAARRHGQRGNREKRFGPSVGGDREAERNRKREGSSKREVNRSGRIQAVVSRKQPRLGDLKTEAISDDEQ
ncbi:unnamed protein product [Caenorhabditis sp. 36 PRJEB53466]|nr:unnamed protein product [Caenorhabditis sp. 36 PRJEB53466]